jgi:hypothetical protein
MSAPISKNYFYNAVMFNYYMRFGDQILCRKPCTGLSTYPLACFVILCYNL